MNAVVTKLKKEADEIRRALNFNSGLWPQRLGNAERALLDAIREIERLEKQLAEKRALPQSIQEALNSGDGSYRP